MKKLPVIGSTAASTEFASESLSVGDLVLHLDGNQKIFRDNGTWESPGANALSLLASSVEGADGLGMCPGATPTCRSSCYVRGLAKHAADLYALYRENTAAIRRILSDSALAGEWAMALAGWISARAPGGFRWHVSGDVFSREHAEWIADVCRESPEVEHWIYTRSFDLVGPLVEVSTNRGGNLALNLSADKDNYHEARVARFAFGRRGAAPDDESAYPRICYLVEAADPRPPEDLPPGSTLFPDYDLRPRGVADPTQHPWWASLSAREKKMVCPVDAFNKSPERRCGPCARCLT